MPPGRRSRRRGGPKSLTAGRPPTLHKQPSNLPSKATRSLIQHHHRLNKEHARALASGDQELAASLQAQIDLPAYQAASKTGQSSTRGGDSSKTLITWLSACAAGLEHEIVKQRKGRRFRMLEVGALTTRNACSTCGLFDVERIDLNAQEKGITKQDFMERPLPKDDTERFDIVSLSLVLNYVGSAEGRGEMLRRCRDFLIPPDQAGIGTNSSESKKQFPSLFLVLPAPCVTNSRYLDNDHLNVIMESLGFTLMFQKQSAKLAYYLWVLSGKSTRQQDLSKIEVNPGKARNNFAIIVKS